MTTTLRVVRAVGRPKGQVGGYRPAAPGIPAMLRALRLREGMTQERLGQLSGLGKSGVSRIECGVQALTAANLNRYVESLGYTCHITFRKKPS